MFYPYTEKLDFQRIDVMGRYPSFHILVVWFSLILDGQAPLHTTYSTTNNGHVEIMSNKESQSYYNFSSSSYSSSTNSSGFTHTVSMSSNPSGTTVHETSQVAGRPAQSKTTRIPADGTKHVEGLGGVSRRIEDVTDTEKQSEE